MSARSALAGPTPGYDEQQFAELGARRVGGRVGHDLAQLEPAGSEFSLKAGALAAHLVGRGECALALFGRAGGYARWAPFVRPGAADGLLRRCGWGMAQLVLRLRQKRSPPSAAASVAIFAGKPPGAPASVPRLNIAILL